MEVLMLDFEQTNDGLILSLNGYGRKTINSLIDKDQDPYDAIVNHFDGHNDPSWIFTHADKITGNLSEAPVFFNYFETLRTPLNDYGQFDLLYGDFFYYDAYMLHCFARKLGSDERIFFHRA